MATNTLRLHRVLRATPERIYRAFVNPDAMAKWLPPHGFTGKVHHMDARVGGSYKMSFTDCSTGPAATQELSFGAGVESAHQKELHGLLLGSVSRSLRQCPSPGRPR